MLMIGILTFISLGTFKSEAFGRGRIFNRGGSCCNVVAVREVVAVQEVFAFPVLIPAYQFQYAPPAIAVQGIPAATYPTIQQPYAYGQPQQFTQPQPYYGQPQQFAQPQQFGGLNKDKIKELAQALIEEMNRQLEGGDNQPSVPQSNANPTQPPTLGVNVKALQYQALTAMSRNCSACHTGIGSKKGQIIFSQPGFFNPVVNLTKLKEEVINDRMPPIDSQYRLTPQEKGTILEWLRLRGV